MKCKSATTPDTNACQVDLRLRVLFSGGLNTADLISGLQQLAEELGVIAPPTTCRQQTYLDADDNLDVSCYKLAGTDKVSYNNEATQPLGLVPRWKFLQ